MFFHAIYTIHSVFATQVSIDPAQKQKGGIHAIYPMIFNLARVYRALPFSIPVRPHPAVDLTKCSRSYHIRGRA